MAAIAEREAMNLSETAEALWREARLHRQRDAGEVSKALLSLPAADRGFALLAVLAIQASRPRGDLRRTANTLDRLIRRLASPENGALIRDTNTPEDEAVDDLLEVLGYDSSHQKHPNSEETWASQHRALLGLYEPVVIAMREAAMAEIIENGQLDRHKPKPEAVKLVADAHARYAADPTGAVLHHVHQDLAFAQDKATFPAEAQRLVFLRRAIEDAGWLAQVADPETLGWLRGEIASAAASLGAEGAAIVAAAEQQRARRQQQEAARAGRRKPTRRGREG